MRKNLSYLTYALTGLLFLSSPVFAQSTSSTTGNEASAGYVRDWTSDGTRDHLLSEAQKFFGNVAQFYIALPPEEAANSELVSTQFDFAFHGYPEPEIDLPSGRKLFVGADPESQREKALIVTESDRATMRAIAILHHSCGGKKRFDRVAKKFTTCPRLTTLTFFVHDGDNLDEDVKTEVVKWVRNFAKRNNKEVRKQTLKSETQFIRAIKVEVNSLPGQ